MRLQDGEGEIMHTIHPVDQKLWKQHLHDALLELDPKAFREKLKAADKAIELRHLELASAANPDPIELAELMDGLNTLRALGFLKDSNGFAECR
jgi:hypothetical protein